MRLNRAFLLTFILTGFGQFTVAQDPVGMVLSVAGQVHLQRGSESVTAQLAELIFEGDELALSGGEVVVLFCPAAERVSAKGEGQLSVGGSSITASGAVEVAKTPMKGCALPKVALGSESLERVGGVRSRGYPPLAIYLGGAICSSRPVFRWESIPEAEEYHVLVRDEMGAVIWEAETAGKQIALPEALELEEGFYGWNVTAEASGQILAQQMAGFEYKPHPELPRSPADTPEDILLYGTQLEGAGYFSEAAVEFRKLRELQSGDADRITRHLAWLYWEAGLLIASQDERDLLVDSGSLDPK